MKTVHNARLDKLEEDVIAALVGLLVSHSRLLKQIDVNEATSQLSHVVEVDPDELTEPGEKLYIGGNVSSETLPGGVVVSDGLCIAVRLKDWVGVHNPVLQIGFLLFWRVAVLPFLSLRSSKDGKIGDDLLGVLGLSGPRLTGNLEG